MGCCGCMALEFHFCIILTVIRLLHTFYYLMVVVVVANFCSQLLQGQQMQFHCKSYTSAKTIVAGKRTGVNV